MKIPEKRLKGGFRMPAFGLGTWQMGGRAVWNPLNDDAADVRSIRSAIDAGITHIDTAEMYASGHAELLVGKAIKGIDRKKLFITSKVSPEHLTYKGILNSAAKSLERIGTDYLDLYLIHFPNPLVPISESMRAMDKLVDDGLVRNIGLSNFSAGRFEKAQECADHKIVADQLHYNLIFREPERKGVLDYCQENDIMLIAWRPVQKGILTERGTPILDEICDAYGKTPSQVAINWLISQRNVATISKMGGEAHLKENLGAIGWKLKKADVERLRSDFPGQRYMSDIGPLI